MEILDFCSLSKTIQRFFRENSALSQVNFVGKMFETFMHDDDTDFEDIDAAQCSRWMKGQLKISPSICKYYQDDSHHQIDLNNDIRNHIVSRIYDIEMAGRELNDLLSNDTSISDSKKAEIQLDEPIKTEDELAEFITYLVLFVLERPFIKRGTADYELLTSGSTSPSVFDYIYMDEVPEPTGFFLGREKELKKLHELLCTNSKVFVSGIAGIGKSELAKAYAKAHRTEYTNVMYLSYSGSLYEDIAGLDFAADPPRADKDTLFKKHDRFLRSLKEDTLLIIDNFNKTPDKDSQ